MDALAGTGTMIRFILRRDRLRLLLWILGITGMLLATAASFPDLYPTAADRQARAEVMDSPMGRAFAGPGYGLEDYTFGAMLAIEMLGYAGLAIAFMSIFLIVRHTRAEEESGRAEMVRASVTGKYAMPVAVLVVVGGAIVVIAALLAAGLPAIGAGLSPGGSLSFALSLASIGIVFAGVALLTAQIADNGRGAIGMASAVLGVAFSLRAAGDMTNGLLSWLSPIGWAQATRTYVHERWWPLLLPLGLSILLVGLAMRLSTRRDLGAGLLASRPGPATASRSLGHPLGLAFRLQRGTVIGWGVALGLFGLAYGSLIGEVEQFAAENERVQEILIETGGATFADSFAATIALFLALIASIFAVQSALRPRSEESAGRVEPLLATALSRSRWVGAYITIALAGSAGILLLGGLGMGISAAVATGDRTWILRMLGASAAHVPALWLCAGLATALFGLVPRLVALAWALIGYGFIVGMLGGLLNLPGWTGDLSPFAHTPAVPAVTATVGPLAGLTALAAVLMAAGVVGFQRRDIEA